MTNALLSQIASGGSTGPSPVEMYQLGQQVRAQRERNALKDMLLKAQVGKELRGGPNLNALYQRAFGGDRSALPEIAAAVGPDQAAKLMELAKGPQEEPAFQGTGMDAQAMNVVIEYNRNRQQGKPIGQKEKMAYDLASQRLTQPKIVTLASGEQVVYPGMDLSSMSGQIPLGGMPPAGQFTGRDVGPLGGRVISQKPYTEGQTKSAEFANRMTIAESRLGEIEKTYDPTNVKDWASGKIPFGNYMMSDEGQLYRQAQEDWVRAKLRLESGAAIGADEMSQEIKTYFPQPGDSPAVVKQKAKARRTAIDNLQKGSQGAYDRMFGQNAGKPQDGRQPSKQQAPQSAIDFLKKNPQFKDQFRAKYGYVPEGM